MSDAEAREFELLLEERGYELADSWRWRLAHCGTPELGPILWYLSPDRRSAYGGYPACGIAAWCSSCEKRRAARGRRRLEAALRGGLEMWTLTVPEVRQKKAGTQLGEALARRRVLLDAWARLRRVGGVRTWGWGAELVPPTHWHLHCLVPRGTAHQVGRRFAPWEAQSWAGWRWTWGELVFLSWQAAGQGSYPSWVRTGWGAERRPFASALVSQRGDERAMAYASKYASKPAAEVPGLLRAQYAATLWKARRVCVYRGAPRPPRWIPVPQHLAPAQTGRLEGREARELAERVGDHAAQVREILSGQ